MQILDSILRFAIGGSLLLLCSCASDQAPRKWTDAAVSNEDAVAQNGASNMPPSLCMLPVKNLIVFFANGKSDLDSDARHIIAEAADLALNDKLFAGATITGHTHTVGSMSYNRALSLRRAKAVRNELIRLGVARRFIKVAGAGYDELLVSTGPGVAEPQNRRVVIDMEF